MRLRWGRILFIVFLVYFVWAMATSTGKINSQKAEITQLMEEQERLELENKEMTEQKTIVGNEEYLEYVLRTKLGWIKSNETKYSAAG